MSETEEYEHPAMPPIERYITDDGKIGVLVSVGPDSAWSTCIRQTYDPKEHTREVVAKQRWREEVTIFDKDVIGAFLEGDIILAKDVAEEKIGLLENPLEITDLRVEWVAPGDEFVVERGPHGERVTIINDIVTWQA